MKKKAIALIVAVLALVLASAAALCACKPKPVSHDGEVIKVSTAQEFAALRDKVGAEWQGATVELQNDIDLGTWDTPIGSHETSAFTSTFNGGGHTIRYTLSQDVHAQLEEHEERAENEVFALFGYLSGAKIHDLNVNAALTLNANADTGYVGGLAGFAMGGVQLQNVSVDLSLTVRMVGKLSYKYNEKGQVVATSPADDQVWYVGGAVGYVTGGGTMKDVTSAVQADVQKIGADQTFDPDSSYDLYDFLIGELNFGGICGYARPVSASDQGEDRLTAGGLSSTGTVRAFAMRANVGGLFGYVKKGELSDSASDLAQTVWTRYRMSAGGLVGRADQMKLEKLQVGQASGTPLANTYWRMGTADEGTVARNAGGLFGYLDECEANTLLANVDIRAGGSLNYAGALAGIVKESKVSNAAVAGRVDKMGAAWTNRDKFGGAVGRVRGASHLFDIDVNVQSLYGTVAESLNGIVIEEGEGDKVQADDVIETVPVIADSVTYLASNAASARPLPGATEPLADNAGTPVNSDAQWAERVEALLAALGA